MSIYPSVQNNRLQSSAQSLFGSFSGGGGGGGSDCFTIDICPDILIAAIAAAAAGAFYLIYQGITMAMRRRKRGFMQNPADEFWDMINLGKIPDIVQIFSGFTSSLPSFSKYLSVFYQAPKN